MTSIHHKSEKQDWGTPQEFFDKLHGFFDFSVDVCAHAGNRKLLKYWDEKADGLKQFWLWENCWCNPPYGREVSQWVDKAIYESDKAALIVMLIAARTDTQWFQKAVGSGASVVFIKGRLKFEGAKNPAPFPSALLIWGSIPPGAVKYFNEIGFMLDNHGDNR